MPERGTRLTDQPVDRTTVVAIWARCARWARTPRKNAALRRPDIATSHSTSTYRLSRPAKSLRFVANLCKPLRIFANLPAGMQVFAFHCVLLQLVADLPISGPAHPGRLGRIGKTGNPGAQKTGNPPAPNPQVLGEQEFRVFKYVPSRSQRFPMVPGGSPEGIGIPFRSLCFRLVPGRSVWCRREWASRSETSDWSAAAAGGA